MYYKSYKTKQFGGGGGGKGHTSVWGQAKDIFVPNANIKFEALHVHIPARKIHKKQGSTSFPKFYKPPPNPWH